MVKFDKLNPVVTVQETVPLVGEVMSTRWAFEAMAVYQFKDNDFEKQFFKLDKTFKKIDFRKNYWLSKLREKRSSAQNNFENQEKKDLVIV